MIDKFKGMNVELDLPNQVEFNRRKNVNQDQRLDTLSSQLAELLAQEPAGYLPEVFYGLTAGQQTYRFPANYQFIVSGLEGNDGDSYEIYDEAQSEAYIPAIAIQVDEEKLQVIIKGDYPVYGETFKVVNMRDGSDYEVTLSGALLLQDASYLGALDAEDYKNKQISVLHDIASNLSNVMFCSIDYNNDGNFNWLSIGSFTNGVDGKSVYAINTANSATILALVKAGDSLVLGENMTIGSDSFLLGDVVSLITINPITATLIGNIKGPQGETGSTGAPGADGEDGETPTITDGYWYIGGVNTGVVAVGQDGTDGQDGQSFQVQSGLYSVPANEQQTGNVDPDGNALNTLPTLPTTGVTGKGYVVFDPLTTPLAPYYDLYWANDGDNDWTIMHPYSGIAGQDGTDGLTPFIGANGNWWIGTTDTGVHAQGPAGPQGPVGITSFGGTNTNPAILNSIIDTLNVGDYFILTGYFKLNATTPFVYGNSNKILFCVRAKGTNSNELTAFGPKFTHVSTSVSFDGNYYISNIYYNTTNSNAFNVSFSTPINTIPTTLTGLTGKVLTTDNNISFTPTSNYHPATKLYVDDAVANAGGGGGSTLYRHLLRVFGTNDYFGLWCEIINTTSAAITTMSGFLTAIFNAGYVEGNSTSNPYATGELKVARGWWKVSGTYYQLLAVTSDSGTNLRARYLNQTSNSSSYTNLFGSVNDSGPVGTVEDIVIQIS